MAETEKKLHRFKVVWREIRYGESTIEAETEEQARVLCDRNFDDDYEESGYDSSWEIESIEDMGVDDDE